MYVPCPKQCKVFISVSAKTVQHKYVNRRNYVTKRKNKKGLTCRQNGSSDLQLLGSNFKIKKKNKIVRPFPVALTGKLNIVSRLHLSTI